MRPRSKVRQSVHSLEGVRLVMTNADSTTTLCGSCLVELTLGLKRVFGCLLARLFVLLEVANGNKGHVCTICAQSDLAGMEKLCKEHYDSASALS